LEEMGYVASGPSGSSDHNPFPLYKPESDFSYHSEY